MSWYPCLNRLLHRRVVPVKSYTGEEEAGDLVPTRVLRPLICLQEGYLLLSSADWGRIRLTSG